MDAEGRTQEMARAGAEPQGGLQDDGVCHGLWKLKANVVLREEDDGVILYEPDTDSLSVINAVGGVLLRHTRGCICCEQWCDMLHAHYGTRVERSRIAADVSKFVRQISHFMEPCNGQEK